jgi:hypothetical protein
VGIGVGVGVCVGVEVRVGVCVGVRVWVGVCEGVKVRVGVSEMVPVGVGDWQKVVTVAVPTLPPPEASSSSVPKRPLVLMFRDCPLFNWNVLEAIGVPFSKSVQVPGPVIFEPILVIVKVPCASGVQFAESEKMGGVGVGVAVGDWQKVVTVAVPTLPPPVTSSSSVPKRPLVLMFRDAPALSWKELVAIGVPFSKSVQVPALVISVPILVIVNVPCASGVQLAESEKTGVLG